MRPVLKPFLEAFEPLLTARRLAAEKIAPILAENGIRITGEPSGLPLLPENLPPGLAVHIRMAARKLLPLLCRLESISLHKRELESLFLDAASEGLLEQLIPAMLADSADLLAEVAQKSALEAPVLEFASSFIVSAVLRALAMPLSESDFPDWHKSVCPVCGSPPIIAWLNKRAPMENSEFLASGGGKKSLYCGTCGTAWHFMRGVCPGCGTQGKDAMHILGEEERRHERIDWCKKCKSYLPQVDLREMAAVPDMDAMALCLMHLDLAAAEKGLTPLKPSFWNMN